MEKDFFDVICDTALRCFIVIFVGTYLLWWLVLDGPAKWDKYFQGKINNVKNSKNLPVLMKDPIETYNPINSIEK